MAPKSCSPTTLANASAAKRKPLPVSARISSKGAFWRCRDACAAGSERRRTDRRRLCVRGLPQDALARIREHNARASRKVGYHLSSRAVVAVRAFTTARPCGADSWAAHWPRQRPQQHGSSWRRQRRADAPRNAVRRLVPGRPWRPLACIWRQLRLSSCSSAAAHAPAGGGCFSSQRCARVMALGGRACCGGKFPPARIAELSTSTNHGSRQQRQSGKPEAVRLRHRSRGSS